MQRQTYNIVSIRSTIHQSNHMSATLGDEHVEALSKAELTHDIVGEITEPIAHILHHTLAFTTLVASSTRQHGAELSNMQQHNILHTLQRSFRESLAEHAPLTPMHSLIDRVMRVIHALDGGERVVEIGFLEPLAVAVDIV